MSVRRRRARGAATVELAIAVVILVPTIMYSLFLEDLLYYKLEQYESLSSPAWDYLPLDYNDDKVDESKGSIGRFARLTYCDHTSLYNSYDRDYECNDNHHNGTVTTAHQCWMVESAQQVHCNANKDDFLGSAGDLEGLKKFNDTYHKGGVFECNARLGVMNYFLPNKFFTWSEEKTGGIVTTKKRYKGSTDDRQNDDVHKNYKAEDPEQDAEVDTEENANIVFVKEHFAVLHDPWATNYPPKSDGDNSSGRFFDRMNVYYTEQGKKGGAGYTEAEKLGKDLNSKKLIGDGAIKDSPGDDVATPPLAWSEEAERNINGHTASGWEDERQSSSHGSRSGSYFGMGENDW